jgi:hypothetical protein
MLSALRDHVVRGDRRRISRGEHRRRDRFGVFQSHAADCGTAAAQEAAESPGGFAGGDDAAEKRDQFLFAKRLMQMVRERAAKQRVILRREGGGDPARIGAALRGGEAVELRGQDAAAAGVEISKSGISKTKRNFGDTSKRATSAPPATVNPPKAPGAALSGWPSNSAHSRKSSRALSERAGEFVEAMQQPEAHGDAAPEPAGARNFAHKCASQMERLHGPPRQKISPRPPRPSSPLQTKRHASRSRDCRFGTRRRGSRSRGRGWRSSRGRGWSLRSSEGRVSRRATGRRGAEKIANAMAMVCPCLPITLPMSGCRSWSLNTIFRRRFRLGQDHLIGIIDEIAG